MDELDEGDLRPGTTEQRDAIISSADWYNMHNLDISGESADVECATKWTGEYVKGFHNYGATTATVILKTRQTPGTAITIKLAAEGYIWKLPAIKTIVKSGTSDDLVVFTQRYID